MLTEWAVRRFSSQRESTLGLLLREGEFRAFTLEDEFRTQKVMGETRIPGGRYQIGYRDWGGFYDRYRAKWPDWHGPMLEILDVPGFTDVLIHIGNDDDDTAGCLLVGDSAEQNLTKPGFVGASTDAYRRIYREFMQDAAMGGVYLEVGNL